MRKQYLYAISNFFLFVVSPQTQPESERGMTIANSNDVARYAFDSKTNQIRLEKGCVRNLFKTFKFTRLYDCSLSYSTCHNHLNLNCVLCLTVKHAGINFAEFCF